MRNGNINYQILEKKNSTGHYIPDFEAFISDASCPEEEEYIRSVQHQFDEYERKGYPEFAGFAFEFVFVVRNSCGHYEMYQNPYMDGDLAGCLKMAEIIAGDKCTKCHISHLK